MKPWRALNFLATVLTVFVFFSPALSQSTRLMVSFAADTPANLQVFVAKETGIFARNGLDVQLVRIAGNVAVMALLAGEVDVNGQVGGSVVIASDLGGSNTAMIAAGVVASDYVLVSQRGIKTPKQLKGGILGVSSFSGSSMLSTQFVLRKLGLDPNKDVSIILIGQASDRFLALRTGRIQATLLTPPQWILAEKDGFNILADVTALPFPYSTVATTRRFIKENPETVKKYVKSQIDAVHLMKTKRDTGVRVLAKYLRQNVDPEILEKTYNLSVTDVVLPRKQYPDLAGIKTVLDMMTEREPKAAKAKPEQFVDMRFVKELDDTGYTDSLYK